MRKIKFRAWNTEVLFMILPDDVIGYEKDQFPIVGNDYRVSNDDEFLQLLYTGFKDKNGVEIYDGDILSERVKVDGKMINLSLQVFWNEYKGSWHLDHSFHQDKTCSVELWQELNDFKYKVIGNIFENNELLKTIQ